MAGFSGVGDGRGRITRHWSASVERSGSMSVARASQKFDQGLAATKRLHDDWPGIGEPPQKLDSRTLPYPTQRTLGSVAPIWTRRAKSWSLLMTAATRSIAHCTDRCIGRLMEPDVEYVFRFNSLRRQPTRQRRRQLRVDDEAHLRAPKHGMVLLAGRKFEHGRDVI